MEARRVLSLQFNSPIMITATHEPTLVILSILVSIFGVYAATEFARRMRRLQRQRALLDELFNQAPMAVALMRQDRRVVRVNEEFLRLFGFSSGEVIGRRLGDVLVSADESDPQFGGGEVEAICIRRDGSSVPVAVRRVRVDVSAGDVETYAIFRDLTQQRKAEETLRTYPRRLLEATEAEEKRIAGELHDHVGQVLTGVGMLLSPDEAMPEQTRTRVVEAQALLQELAGRVRNLALDLRPELLDDFGLVPSLQALFKRYTRHTHVRVQFDHSGVSAMRFPPEIEMAAYRIVQEALTNVAKHAGVHEAKVRVAAGEVALTIAVEDRGFGIASRRNAPDESLGVANMRERARTLGGHVVIRTPTGGGTRVEAMLPLRGSADDEERAS